MAWAIFLFYVYPCILKATVYGGVHPRNESRVGSPLSLQFYPYQIAFYCINYHQAYDVEMIKRAK